MRGGLWAVLVASAVLSVSAAARAQCATDMDCKGDRICEEGACVAPPPAPVAAPTPAPPPEAAPPPAPEREVRRAPLDQGGEGVEEKPEGELQQQKQRRSTGMMVAGIVLTSLAPIILYVGIVSNRCSSSTSSCSNQTLAVTVTTLALLGVGIPLIVVGAKRVPVTRVSVGPWLAPRQGGLQLRLDL